MTDQDLTEIIAHAKRLYPASDEIQVRAFGRNVQDKDKAVVLAVLEECQQYVRGPAFAPWDSIYAELSARTAQASKVRFDPRTGEILADVPKVPARRQRLIDHLRKTDPQQYPPDRSDSDCICHHYRLIWDGTARKFAADSFRLACGRNVAFGHCRFALTDCGIAEDQAETMAREVVGLQPGEVLKDPWSVRDVEVVNA